MLGYIALGSNLGDRQANIEAALERMEQRPGLSVLRVSSLHETEPEGFASPRLFYNSVAEIEWKGEPLALLRALKEIEAEMGRAVSSAPAGPEREYEDRNIDLDIVWLDGVAISTPELTIPHPRAKDRPFVLLPLDELNPELAAELWPGGK